MHTPIPRMIGSGGVSASPKHTSRAAKNLRRRMLTFLARPNAARPQLGVALRSIWDWAVRAWMLSLTPGQSPVKSNLKKWGLTATAQCDCGQGDETFLHQQLHCHLTHRRNMKQTAHNNVAKVNRKSGTPHQPRDTTCSVGPHFLDTLCQRKYSQSQQSQYTVPKAKTRGASQTV